MSGDTVNILGKHSLDLPVEHPTHGLRQLLTRSLGLARACYPKLQNAARFGSFTGIQSSSSVRGRIPQWLGAYFCPAPAVCRGPKSSQPFKKYFLRNQKLPDLCLPLASFSLCTSTLLFSFILFLTRGEESHFTESWDGRGWKGTLKIILFHLVASLFFLVTTSAMPLCTCTAPPGVLTFPFLDKRTREDAHEPGQADQLHRELLKDFVHGTVELRAARVPRVLNHLGQPKTQE